MFVHLTHMTHVTMVDFKPYFHKKLNWLDSNFILMDS